MTRWLRAHRVTHALTCCIRTHTPILGVKKRARNAVVKLVSVQQRRSHQP